MVFAQVVVVGGVCAGGVVVGGVVVGGVVVGGVCAGGVCAGGFWGKIPNGSNKNKIASALIITNTTANEVSFMVYLILLNVSNSINLEIGLQFDG